jgi:hypothetical protein
MPVPARYLLAFTGGMVHLAHLCRSFRLSRRRSDLDRRYAGLGLSANWRAVARAFLSCRPAPYA